MVVAHHMDSNWTLIETTSHCTTEELIRDRHRILDRMKSRGIVPKHQILDNEISAEYIAEIELTKMTYQLVLPTTIAATLQKRQYNFGRTTS